MVRTSPARPPASARRCGRSPAARSTRPAPRPRGRDRRRRPACRPRRRPGRWRPPSSRRRRGGSAGRRACPRPSGCRSAAGRTPTTSRSVSSSTTLLWAITRRIVVHRCPAVPAAENTMPRVARSRSALALTMAALLPPSSSSERPNRPATRGPTARPIRVEPVALSRATPGWSTRASPTSGPPIRTCDRSVGAPTSAMARARIAWLASDVSGVSSDGFHTTGSPHTSATAVFQDQTAAGKLKALMTPTTPSGCQVSISRCPGRSDGIVRPYSCRERPTAKSQMSIISWTSPRASEVILPTSRLISVARSSLCSASSSPSRLTRAPRAGAGTFRHARKALCARSTASSTDVASDHASELRRSPLTGEVASTSPAGASRSTPQAPRRSGSPGAGARCRWGWWTGSSCAGSFGRQTMLSSGRMALSANRRASRPLTSTTGWLPR